MPDRTALRTARWTLPLVVLVLGGSIGAGHSAGGRSLVLVSVLAAVAGLAGPAALLRPRLAVLADGVAVGTYFALGLANGPIFLSVPLVSFVAAQRLRPRPLAAVLGPAFALVVAGLVVRTAEHGASGFVTLWQAVGLGALSLAACTLGWWLTDRRAARTEQARRTATEERLRMAQELHDGVGHGLAVIAMHAGVALHLLDRDAGPPVGLDPRRRGAEHGEPDRGPRAELQRISRVAGDAVGDGDGGRRDGDGSERARLRQSLEAIRSASVDSLDALRSQLALMAADTGAPAPRRPAAGLGDVDDLLDRVRAGGLRVERLGDPGEVPQEAGRIAHAVVQESLTNVLRHARAGAAIVTIVRAGQHLVVTVEDDGPGEPDGGPGGGGPGGWPDSRGPGDSGPGDSGPAQRRGQAARGMGIRGMRERVERAGGTLVAGSTGSGFEVRARIPVTG